MILALDAAAVLMVLGVASATLGSALGALRARASRRELGRYLRQLLEDARTTEPRLPLGLVDGGSARDVAARPAA